MTNGTFLRVFIGGCGLVVGAIFVLTLKGAAVADAQRLAASTAAARAAADPARPQQVPIAPLASDAQRPTPVAN